MKTPPTPRSAAPASRCSRKSLLLAAMAVLMGAAAQSARAQTYTVTSTAASGTGSLVDAIYQANLGNYNEISIQSGLGTISLSSQMLIYSNVTIEGNGNVLDMNNSDRAFFIVGGEVNISNLTIQNGKALGGSGGNNAGGGAGLGGAIFVAHGASIQSTLNFITDVTLTNVTFQNNNATGGAGGNYSISAQYSGGGGMGGNGASGGSGVTEEDGGGGGGGFGNGANGGDGSAGDGGAGAFVLPNIAIGSAGDGGYAGGSGAANGGGGGGGSGGITFVGAGGGGGVNASDASHGTATSGGFGGGGGGSTGTNSIGGSGGFGGGGGVSSPPANIGSTENEGYSGGNGGFGGGGASSQGDFPNNGGFGGGGGSYNSSQQAVAGGGGGGAGMGGAIFVMAGANLTIVMDTTAPGALAFTGNTVNGGAAGTGGTPGVAAVAGSAIGGNVFLGGNATFDIAQASDSFSVTGLGGAGDTDDPNVAAHPNDPNAQGGLIKQGAGTLVLTGTNYYSGQTVINSGTLQLAAGAVEQGSSGVIVGQNAGDVATLAFNSGSLLNLTGTAGIVLGQAAGSTGTVIIGADGLNGADLGLPTISGGTGGGQVIFNQSTAASGTGPYPMYSNLTGNLSVVQDGTGTTILSPRAAYGKNTYTGGTQVKNGTLVASASDTLGSGAVTVSGGTLSVTGGAAITNAVTMSGGQYTVAVNLGGGYAGMANATSDLVGGTATTASVAAGTASAATTLTTSFATTSTALNDDLRLSDVYSFSGTGTDIFVLELSMTSVGAGSYLGWLNTSSNTWVNAVEGNTGGNTATAEQQGYAGSFAAFQSVYGTTLTSYLGAYGADTTTGTVWAVVNHNSDFSVVPEPSTWALLLAGAGSAIVMALRRKAIRRAAAGAEA